MTSLAPNLMTSLAARERRLANTFFRDVSLRRVFASQPARAAEAELQELGEERVVGRHRTARAVRLEAERSDARAPELAQIRQPRSKLALDGEVQGDTSASGSPRASARPASSRAASMPPKSRPSARASRIHFSTG